MIQESMMNLLLSIALVHLIAVISPGPNFAVVARSAMASGARSGFGAVFGVVSASFVFVAISLFGLSFLISQNPYLLKIISIFGASFLIYLGIRCLRSEGIKNVSIQANKVGEFRSGYATGFVTAITNPKAFLYFMSIFSQLIKPEIHFQNRILIAFMVSSISTIWFSLVVGFISHPTIREKFIHASRWIDRIMGVIFIGFAVKILSSFF